MPTEALSASHPEWRGLLASPGLEGQPIKGVYFFPGESGGPNTDYYTTHPVLPDDSHWNSDLMSRVRVMDRMVKANVNTVIMSYWSNMPQWSPMVLDTSQLKSNSLTGVLDVVQGRPLTIIPALESGFDSNAPQIPHWQFADEFPIFGNEAIAPGLVWRIGQLKALFAGRMNLWGRVYDRDGTPRYAVQILHVCSNRAGVNDDVFANSFFLVEQQIQRSYGIKVGFLLDLIGGCRYSAPPSTAGPKLERQPSVLAANGFVSEVFSGKVVVSPPCGLPWRQCHATDNNADNNIVPMADWKFNAVVAWVLTGLPVILDVSNGFDGRGVWAKVGAAFWGDNLNYTDDRWRNWMSELKGLPGFHSLFNKPIPGVVGITFDTWNGYTEGYAAVPSIEHQSVDQAWLTDLLRPDPRYCDHLHYANHQATFHVYGAICAHWVVDLRGDRGFGPPITDELPSGTGRVSYFADGKAIYWSGATGAFEVHGLIEQTYRSVGESKSCLGFPTSDEQSFGAGRISHFERGYISWQQGMTRGWVVCFPSGIRAH